MNSRSLHKLLLICIAAFPLTDIKAGSTPEPALVINEIMPANIDMFMDPSYNYGSWIELFNGTDTDINLAGYYLSDSASTALCPLGNTSRIVKAGGFLTLWFGHKDDYCMQQLEYSLDSDGGVAGLELVIRRYGNLEGAVAGSGGGGDGHPGIRAGDRPIDVRGDTDGLFQHPGRLEVGGQVGQGKLRDHRRGAGESQHTGREGGQRFQEGCCVFHIVRFDC